ncbi:hypothetical protein F0562_023866 [Nyssa sinensis]|uniref:Uncharacterized protein n=1 Tax=Nyssa sinensis TaxID=561372 RepID=A0A5J5BHM5_9ASTE|nr:hypothetical protein F0562_023866 [Nyssa sinensis]
MDNFNETRVREAKTECFYVKDRRSEYYKKCDSPSLSDEVWRLKNICKNGAFHKRLMGKKIETVKDFLTQFFINPGGLQEILGTSMSTGKWAVTVDHAQRCKLDNKKYKYCPPISQQNTEVVFDVVGRVMGLLSQQCHFVSIDQLSEKEKADARKLVLSPYEHRDRVVPIDETSLVHGASCSSNALAPSNSPMLESPKASNIETSHMLNGHDHTQTAISTPGIISSNNFVEDMCNLYSFGPCSFSNSEPID